MEAVTEKGKMQAEDISWGIDIDRDYCRESLVPASSQN